MSFNDGEMHAFAAIGAVLLTAAIMVPTVIWVSNASASSDDEHPLEDMEAIEASIAYKKAPAKQPQKKAKPPDPVVKDEGVSRDENKKLDAQCCTNQADCTKAGLAFPTKCADNARCEANRCVQEKPDKPSDNKVADVKIPNRSNFDENSDVNNKTTTEVGEFNDNARGFAETTSGDPFFQELAADFHENWEFPKILSASGTAAGCLHILADGTIKKTKLEPKSGDDALDDSIERALKKIEKLRNAKPVPVPTHLLKQATTRWICFRANPQEQQRE
ncbi:MAG TPA: TonB C-terminal domain-containing protein [Kofleriaceae bacterium]|nr:TonB C-terminal domain-containing protein [Kofleriaceae bacterium]